MHQRTFAGVSMAAATALLAGACSDITRPSSPEGSDDAVTFQQSDDPVALARQVPGFGGFFFDQQGRPTIYLSDLSHQ